MDRDKRERINQLCTQAGMIMEDCSTVALMMVGNSNQELGDQIRRLQIDTAHLGVLIETARSLAVET